MSESSSLQDTIDEYETQLLQVQQALQNTPPGQNKKDLLSLESNIKELLQLTKGSVSNSNGATKSTNYIEKASSSMDDEYALFMAEMANLEEPKSKEEAETNNADDEFDELEGTKCRAPYGSSYGGTTYHNAMICSILKDETIMARVMFINPTHKEMLPCPYFLEGTCRFSEDQCHFSHGHVVPFENLKEYKEPDYSSIKVGSVVLAKAKNKLWHRAIVLDDSLRVKFESSGAILEMSLQDLFPLSNEDLNLSDSSDDSEGESEEEKEIKDIYTEKFVHQSLLTSNSNQPLGDWEKYTKGIGSKLMGKMGYVMGMGLGKEADGRIDPVEALVMPAGKSLDHCMALREIAGGDKDFFSAEKILKKQEKKLEEQRNRDYQKQKDAEKHNVFNFINTTLGDKPKDSQPSTSKVKKSLKTESLHKLNVESFKIGENINKLEAESSKLKNALTRHSKGSIHYNNLVSQYNEKQKEIGKLKISERQIAAEQKERKVKSKLSIF